MAMINLTFDTQTKEFSCTMDGEEVADLNSLEFYKYEDDEGSIRIQKYSINKEEGFGKSETVYACEQPQDPADALASSIAEYLE